MKSLVVAGELAPFSICRSPRSVSAVRAKADMTLRQQNFGLDRYAATQLPWHFKGGFAVRPVTQETRHFQNQTRTPKAKYGRYPPSLWERVVILNRFRNMAVVGRKSAMGLGCVKNAEIEFANGNFVSTSINLKNKSAGDGPPTNAPQFALPRRVGRSPDSHKIDRAKGGASSVIGLKGNPRIRKRFDDPLRTWG